ncbi:hypothetical protein [Pectobacterium parmentieri]|uniref:hypothetical protein n=1 Tax=Pectobacterium parmentieri TaxID=1905730 RepID=UPI001E4B3873|nr:hypothetical protein [Pectobacterium parmentieri]
MTDLLSKENIKKINELAANISSGNGLFNAAEIKSITDETLQRREAAEKPIAEIRCMEDMSLCVENVTDGFSLGRHKVFAEPPLTSAERERLVQLEAKVVHYESETRARNSFDQTPDIIKRADEAERKVEQLEARLAAYDRAAKDNKPLAWIVEPIFEPYSSRGRRSLIDGNIYDVDGGEFWAEGAREKHSVTPLYALSQMPVIPKGLHPSTAKLIVDFTTALAEKLHKAELKYGYNDDWAYANWEIECHTSFHEHIAKGDPRDVAAYCAFMWYHGWKTEALPLPVVPQTLLRELVDVVWQDAKESTEVPSTEWADELIGKVFTAAQVLPVVPDEMAVSDDMTVTTQMFARGHNACRAAMLQSSPAQSVCITAEHQRVIAMLLGACGAAFELADDTCQQEVDGELRHVVPHDAFQKLSDALDEIENTLPNFYPDLPNTVLTWAAVPRHALKSLLQLSGKDEQVSYPAIPEGWVLVPIKPTESMIIDGFESEPDESFSKSEDWEAYQAMSGCEQAAHRAHLCWAAMIAAATKSGKAS